MQAEANTLCAHFLSVDHFFHRRGRELDLKGLLERAARGLVIPDGVKYALGHDAAQMRSKLTGDMPHRSFILICPDYEHRIFVVWVVVFRKKCVAMVFAENIRRIDVAHAYAAHDKGVCHGGLIRVYMLWRVAQKEFKKRVNSVHFFLLCLNIYLHTKHY